MEELQYQLAVLSRASKPKLFIWLIAAGLFVVAQLIHHFSQDKTTAWVILVLAGVLIACGPILARVIAKRQIDSEGRSSQYMTASPSDDENVWTIEKARDWWEANNHKCDCGNEIPTLEDAYQHGVCFECLQKQNQ